MIKLEDISITFGLGTALEKTALQKVNLDIHSGDFITLIGSNGAGKSTLLNLLAGELIPDTGKIFFANEDVSHQPLELRAKLISRVFQDPRNGVCEEFTLEENLALAIKRGKRRGFSLAVGNSQRNYFKSLLTEAGIGLENRLTDRVANLSG
ncbi:MAG: ATP-binding cassette domain-containing protein, partial [Gammaproteobacteria bacterium]